MGDQYTFSHFTTDPDIAKRDAERLVADLAGLRRAAPKSKRARDAERDRLIETLLRILRHTIACLDACDRDDSEENDLAWRHAMVLSNDVNTIRMALRMKGQTS